MSITNKIVEALLAENKDFYMTIEDIRHSTIKEILLYFAYNRVMHKSSQLATIDFF
jgi:hypothetical protein